MNEVNTDQGNAGASACSSLDGGQVGGSPSVQAVATLKQFRKVIEKRISELDIPEMDIHKIASIALAWGKQNGYERILLDIDIAIAEAECDFSR